MRDIMYDIPSNPKIKKCIITKDTVEKNEEPQIVIDENKVVKKQVKKKKIIQKRNTETA